jgi:hypothetical protein
MLTRFYSLVNGLEHLGTYGTLLHVTAPITSDDPRPKVLTGRPSLWTEARGTNFFKHSERQGMRQRRADH